MGKGTFWDSCQRGNGMPVDAISLEVFKNMFISVSEEMGVALLRTSYSPNMKERQDFFLRHLRPFRADGRPRRPTSRCTWARCRRRCRRPWTPSPGALRPGDMVILNDPYLGGTHLPDITLVAPRLCYAGRGKRRKRVGGVRFQPGPPRRRGRHDARFPALVHRVVPGRADSPAH